MKIAHEAFKNWRDFYMLLHNLSRNMPVLQYVQGSKGVGGGGFIDIGDIVTKIVAGMG